MKFDLIISNPPFRQNMHLKILQDVYKLGEKICFVHPATWLYDNKYLYKRYKETCELVKDHFISYEKVENANKIFGIGLFTDLFITYINKNKTGIGDAIYNIDIHGNSKIYKSLKKKILKYKLTLYDKVKNDNDYNNPKVSFSGIGKFYRFIPKTIEHECYGKNSNKHLKFLFNSENEMLNFKDYLKTKIARFCLSIYKINQHLDSGELASVPYMPTYTRLWTDEDVAKELGLTEEELAWAINWIPDYYPEDAEKYKKWKI